MILCIADMLTPDEAADLSRRFDKLELGDGKLTAGWLARDVKKNRQAFSGPEAEAMQQIVMGALKRHPLVQLAARPKIIRAPLLSAYGISEEYGAHVDDALMGNPPTRSDLSCTVFLSAPEEYDGGELVIETPGGEQSIKLPLGAAVVYPSTTLHRVNAVTRGTRKVAVTWMQSLIRDGEIREMLFDLDRARRSLHERIGRSPEGDLLAKLSANLLRRHAEP